MSGKLKFYALAVVGILAFFMFASSYESVPVKSGAQKLYEAWLFEREEQFRLSPSAFEASPPISLYVVSASPSRPLHFALKTTTRAESERTFRILELIRVANLFSTDKWQTNELTFPGISIAIEDSGKVFRVQIEQKRAMENLQIVTMLKLLQLFSSIPLPTPTPGYQENR